MNTSIQFHNLSIYIMKIVWLYHGVGLEHIRVLCCSIFHLFFHCLSFSLCRCFICRSICGFLILLLWYLWYFLDKQWIYDHHVTVYKKVQSFLIDKRRFLISRHIVRFFMLVLVWFSLIFFFGIVFCLFVVTLWQTIAI